MAETKRGGRPRLAPEVASVTVKMPMQQYDTLCRQAHVSRVSIPEIIRQKLRHTPPKRRP